MANNKKKGGGNRRGNGSSARKVVAMPLDSDTSKYDNQPIRFAMVFPGHPDLTASFQGVVIPAFSFPVGGKSEKHHSTAKQAIYDSVANTIAPMIPMDLKQRQRLHHCVESVYSMKKIKFRVPTDPKKTNFDFPSAVTFANNNGASGNAIWCIVPHELLAGIWQITAETAETTPMDDAQIDRCHTFLRPDHRDAHNMYRTYKKHSPKKSPPRFKDFINANMHYDTNIIAFTARFIPASSAGENPGTAQGNDSAGIDPPTTAADGQTTQAPVQVSMETSGQQPSVDSSLADTPSDVPQDSSNTPDATQQDAILPSNPEVPASTPSGNDNPTTASLAQDPIIPTTDSDVRPSETGIESSQQPLSTVSVAVTSLLTETKDPPIPDFRSSWRFRDSSDF